MFTGFEPIYDSDSKVLILGSFPSVKSRGVNFYYGNPLNQFWKMLEFIFEENIGLDIESKKSWLLKHEIALWDIVKTCEIKGSSDRDLVCLEVVDLYQILDKAKIKKIFCNGKKSYELFCKHYPKLKEMSACLPSTSPANIRFDINKWNELKFELHGIRINK